MLKVEDAVIMFLEKIPNKNILQVNKVNDYFVFESRDKNLKEDEPNYDWTMETVNIQTGEFSSIHGLDLIDYMDNIEIILNEEQVKELISSLAFDE